MPLAPLHDPQLVLETPPVLAAVDGLASRIADTRMLLLFDNFEHLLGAAVELAPLLAACPNLELLVTSRQPLQLSGEQEYAVPPFVHEEAVDFFASRARAVVPDLVIDDAVPQICRRLDDLPLALELAAARVKALSLGQILERLEQRLAFLTGGRRDAPERQQTLRAAIEWSYDLLSEQERRLFAELSAFAGGCTFVAARRSPTQTSRRCSRLSRRVFCASAPSVTRCWKPFASSPQSSYCSRRSTVGVSKITPTTSSPSSRN